MVGSHRSSCDVGLLDSFTRPAEVVRPWPFPLFHLLLLLIALIDFCAQSQWGGGGGRRSAPLYRRNKAPSPADIASTLLLLVLHSRLSVCDSSVWSPPTLFWSRWIFFFLVCFSLLSLRWCSTTSQVLTTLRDSMTRSAERDMDGNFQCKPPTVIIFLSNRFFFFSFVLIFFLSFISMNAFHTRPGCWWVVSSIQKRRNPIKWLLPFLSEIKEKGKKKEIYDAHPAVIRLCRISSSPAATKKEKKRVIYIPRRVCTVFFFYLLEKIWWRKERETGLLLGDGSRTTGPFFYSRVCLCWFSKIRSRLSLSLKITTE